MHEIRTIPIVTMITRTCSTPSESRRDHHHDHARNDLIMITLTCSTPSESTDVRCVSSSGMYT